MSVLQSAFGGTKPSVPAYTIDQSCRFSHADDASMARTPGSATNQRTWSFATWLKRGSLQPDGSNREVGIFQAHDDDSNWARIEIQTDGSLRLQSRVSGGNACYMKPSRLLRDCASWYHILVVLDTTHAEETSRGRIYINGQRVTDFGTYSGFSASRDDTLINSTEEHKIGYRTESGNDQTLDGYLAETHFIDGTALGPESFGELNTDTGEWVPIEVTGLTYGTNGFYLDYADSGDLGDDESGNTNDWTESNLAAVDQRTDSPTNNHMVMNPLQAANLHDPYLHNGNLSLTGAEGGTYGSFVGTFSVSSGKWYWEVELITAAGNYTDWVGVMADDFEAYADGNYPGGADGAGCLLYNGRIKVNDIETLSAASGVDVNTDGHRVSFLLNADADPPTFTVWKEGTPDGGTQNLPTGKNWMPAAAKMGDSTIEMIFEEADFEFTPTAGYEALCAANMTEPTIANPRNYFRPEAYIGTSHARSVKVGSDDIDVSALRDIKKDMMAWWALSDTSDSFGSSNLTNTGTTAFAAGKTGNAASMDGSDDRLSVADNVSLSTGNIDFTISCWAYSDTVSGGLTVCGKHQDGGNIEYILFREGASYFVFRASHDGTTTTDLNGSEGVSATTWYHIVFWHDAAANTLNMQRNGGVIDSTAMNSGGIYDGAADFTIGAEHGGGNHWDGLIDEVGIWKRLLTAGERAALYNGGSGVTYTDFSTSNLWSPDLVWLKRDEANEHKMYDSVRGATKAIEVDTDDAETTVAQGLTSFDADGFTLGTDTHVNSTGDNATAWCWLGGTAVSGTTAGAGSGTSYTGQANADAGFSVIKYEGNSTAGHGIPHHLGVAPNFYVVKNLDDASTAWQVYSTALAGVDYHIALDDTAAELTVANDRWYSASSATLNYIQATTDVNEVNEADDYVMISFANVAGYSQVGSYAGNANVDGPFVYTGFRPAFLLLKQRDGTNQWMLCDSARNPYNPVNLFQFPDKGAVDGTVTGIDFVSNGFKIRSTDTDINDSSNYLYVAFAESPFLYSNAR